jgi:hypothetical protein
VTLAQPGGAWNPPRASDSPALCSIWILPFQGTSLCLPQEQHRNHIARLSVIHFFICKAHSCLSDPLYPVLTPVPANATTVIVAGGFTPHHQLLAYINTQEGATWRADAWRMLNTTFI